jgi:hypothetical protein
MMRATLQFDFWRRQTLVGVVSYRVDAHIRSDNLRAV